MCVPSVRRVGGKGKCVDYSLTLSLHAFIPLEAVQQFKNGRKRRANRASNPKRSDFFSAKSNCETASLFAHNWTFGREDETRFSVLHPASPRTPYPSHASSRYTCTLQIIILHT